MCVRCQCQVRCGCRCVHCLRYVCVCVRVCVRACVCRCIHCPCCIQNKKQCSRQLQCEVPCGISNVVNSSLFISSSLSSLSSTSHAIHRGVQPWGGLAMGGSRQGGLGGGGGLGEGVRGKGEGIFPSTCHILHYHKVLCPKGTSHNN